MPLHFTVLASGSAANASLLQADGRGVLIDLGPGPRQLAKRLAIAGATWSSVRFALLTHTHGDHWNEKTFTHLQTLGIPLCCHGRHREWLRETSPAFAALESARLVRCYEMNQDLEPFFGLRCRPFQVSHDGGVTCGFRFDSATGSLGYAADLGCWEADQAEALADVDVLAIEFNHDVALERASGRWPRLIARVLGDQGHLSNGQAAGLVDAVLRRSAPGHLQHLVQLHLSRECNRPHLARQAAEEVLAEHRGRIRVHTAHQHQPLPTLTLGVRRAAGASEYVQKCFPGFD